MVFLDGRVADLVAVGLAVLQHERNLAEQRLGLLEQNTELTEEIARLMAELHATVCLPPNITPSTSA